MTNEQIKKLLVKAGVYECEINDPEFVVPAALEKFAKSVWEEAYWEGYNNGSDEAILKERG